MGVPLPRSSHQRLTLCNANIFKRSLFCFDPYQAHAAAVCLVVPRLLVLSDVHAEAAAALRVIFAASPAAVAARDVFRSMNALVQQLPLKMFVSTSSVDTELGVISQLRSTICARESSFEELGNVGGAVACNSFIALGGINILIACFNSDLCANKVPLRKFFCLEAAAATRFAHCCGSRRRMPTEFPKVSATASTLELHAAQQRRLLLRSVVPPYLGLLTPVLKKANGCVVDVK